MSSAFATVRRFVASNRSMRYDTVTVSPMKTGLRNRSRSMPTATGVSSASSRVSAMAIVEAVDMNPTSSMPCAIRRPHTERSM